MNTWNIEPEPNMRAGDIYRETDGRFLFQRLSGATNTDGFCAAAAPIMLASLKDLVEEIDFEIEQRKDGGNSEDWAALQEKSNRAHAAIAKAEGRA